MFLAAINIKGIFKSIARWNIVISVKTIIKLIQLKTKTAKARKQHGRNEDFALMFDDVSQVALKYSENLPSQFVTS